MKINWLHWLNFKQKYNLCLNTDDTLAVYQLGWLQPLEAGWDQPDDSGAGAHPDEAGAGAHPDEAGAGAECVMTWKYWKCLELCLEQKKKFLVKKTSSKCTHLDDLSMSLWSWGWVSVTSINDLWKTINNLIIHSFFVSLFIKICRYTKI